MYLGEWDILQGSFQTSGSFPRHNGLFRYEGGYVIEYVRCIWVFKEHSEFANATTQHPVLCINNVYLLIVVREDVTSAQNLTVSTFCL